MPVVRAKPTSPGRRFVAQVKTEGLHKGGPLKSLTFGASASGGRNNHGRITVRHRGGGHKRLHRIIDFKRHDKINVPATVERIEYDPNRSAHLALLLYQDGERRYIIAPRGLEQGAKVVAANERVSVNPGNNMPLGVIPLGTLVHCVELRPGAGAAIIRSAGASAQVVAREGLYTTLRLRSGEMRRFSIECRATVGQVGNIDHLNRSLGKAGAKRWRGVRPTVRGVAMNPVDHPHGGGEGKTSGGRHPVSPWGVPTKGYRTRKGKKSSNRLIVRSRHARRR